MTQLSDHEIIWIDGVSYYKLPGESDEQTRARHAKIDADRVALHGPNWRDVYMARKHRELGILN